MRSSTILSALGGIALASAHFTIEHPTPIGEGSDPESAPCGGETPDISEGSSQLVDVHVGGEAIALKLTHPRCTWLFRATFDENAENDWEEVYPITVQSGLGDFCIPQVTFPEDWAGRRGIISIVSLADDGTLFGCIAANFVSGSADPPTSCNNASSIDAYPTDDPQLQELLGNQTESSDPAETEDADDAAQSLRAFSAASLGSVLTVASMFFLGGALMI